MSNTTKYKVLSYQLTIAAGILILFSAIAISQWHLAISSNFTWMMGPSKLISPDLEVMATALVICGISIIALGVVMMKWKVTKGIGIAVILFSILSLTEMGGFFFGSIIGIVGGIFAFKAASIDKGRFTDLST